MSLFGFSPVYVVNFNPRVFELKCPPKAIKAILAHELSHTLDYVEGGIPGIIGIGVQMISGGTATYEHRTDLRAVFRGHGEGLILYREWIYRQLNPIDLLRKKRSIIPLKNLFY